MKLLIVQYIFSVFYSAEVAERISEDSHGFIFGLNTFMALCIQTTLTLVVNDRVGLSLNTRSKSLVYGGYYTFLGLAFSFVALYNFCKHGCIELTWKPRPVEPISSNKLQPNVKYIDVLE